MQEFTIKGNQGFIRMELQKASDFLQNTNQCDGYDADGIVEIKSGNYYVLGKTWFTTGEVYEFYKQLDHCYRNLKGKAVFWNYEASLKIEVIFYQLGQVVLKGYYKEQAYLDNELLFEIESDQTFLPPTIEELKRFVEHYGH